jgi:hypothetical protein
MSGLAENSRARFSDAKWMPGGETIIVGGVGGIGSWVSLFLSRIGHSIYMYDMDTVETTNLAGQFYKFADIGSPKVEAVRKNCMEMSSISGRQIRFMNGAYTNGSMTTTIMMSCFDNMAARKLMFESWKSVEGRELFVDGRMTAETGQIYFVQKGGEEAYEETLFADDEVEDLPCSFKATSHNGALIGSQMISGLNNFLYNRNVGAELRSVPKSIHYMLDSFYYKTDE